MALSERARRMLARGGRTPHPSDPGEIAGYLERAGVPPFAPVIAFGAEYGGIWYRVRGQSGDERDPMHVRLIRRYDGFGTGGILVLPPEDGDQHYYFRCIEGGRIQDPFFIDQHGTLYVEYVPLASSIARFLESESLFDELMDYQPEWLQVSAGMSGGSAARLAQALDLVPVLEASEPGTTWWANGGLRAIHGSAGRCIVYARTRVEAGHVATLMQEIEPTVAQPYTRTWPYRRDGS